MFSAAVDCTKQPLTALRGSGSNDCRCNYSLRSVERYVGRRRARLRRAPRLRIKDERAQARLEITQNLLASELRVYIVLALTNVVTTKDIFLILRFINIINVRL